MTWFRVDDGLAFHAKTLQAGNAAMGLWVRAGAWCSQHLTDGLVPSHVSLTLGTSAQAKALVAAGLWREDVEGYRFHDWEQSNPRREDVEAEREAAKERMRKAREAKRSGDVRANTERTSPAVTVTPTRPDPTLIQTPTVSEPRKRARPKTGPPDDMLITPEMAAWGREHAPLVRDPKGETTRFLDHARANGKSFIDWSAAWRTWMGNAQKYAERDGVQRTLLTPGDTRTAWVREQG